MTRFGGSNYLRITFSILLSIGVLCHLCQCRDGNGRTCFTNDGNRHSNSTFDFEGFDNESGTPSGEYIVPNIVHFIYFGNQSMTFIDAVCMLAAIKNQKPEKLYIHTDQRKFDGGPYWHVVRDHRLAKGVVSVEYLPLPETIFGKNISEKWPMFHGSDIARLQVLMTYGGIYLDRDSYIVRSLNDFRRYEMTLGWEDRSGISNQVILANKNARFLEVWLECYKHYRDDEWFYNAGTRPTELLTERPYLVHRVKRLLAEWTTIVPLVYLNLSKQWTIHYAIHLLINHQYMIGKNLSQTEVYPVVFNETNILRYEANIRDMALAVYPFNSTLPRDPAHKYPLL